MHLTLGTWRIVIERTAPTSSELARMYDRAAQFWEASLHSSGYDRVYDRLFTQVRAANLLPENAGRVRVLDCGIGAASFSLAYARAAGQPVHIDGVDLSAQMLARACRNLGAAGISAGYYQRDARDLGFSAASFDLALSAHLLEHVADPQAVIGEMVRVLRPGAPLLLVVTQPSLYDELLRLRWRYTTLTTAQIIDWMQAAGLHSLRAYDLQSPGRFVQLRSVALYGIKGVSNERD